MVKCVKVELWFGLLKLAKVHLQLKGVVRKK